MKVGGTGINWVTLLYTLVGLCGMGAVVVYWALVVVVVVVVVGARVVVVTLVPFTGAAVGGGGGVTTGGVWLLWSSAQDEMSSDQLQGVSSYRTE